MTLLGAYLVPELWWDPQAGFSHLEAMIEDALELGVRAFRIRGGPAAAVHACAEDLRRRAPEPLLLGMGVDAGVGQCVPECAALPPLGALAALRDADAIRRAASLTARELRLLGINWALAPVADLAPPDPGVSSGASTLGGDPQRVAEDVVTWVDACQALGVLAEVRHFPGIGGALHDPGGIVARWDADLIPFRGAIDAGVATVRVGVVPVVTREGIAPPAMHARLLIQETLRDTLGFEGLIVGDQLDQAGLGGPGASPDAAVRAVQAGCDLLLAPDDLGGIVDALERAGDAGILSMSGLEASVRRRQFWAAWGGSRAMDEPSLEFRLWARQVADLVVHPVRGTLPALGATIALHLIDEGAVSAAKASRFDALQDTLRAAGCAVHLATEGATPDEAATVIAYRPAGVPLEASASGAADAAGRIAAAVARARDRHRPVVVVVFGPPECARRVEAPMVLCAWSEDRAMQEGAARRLAG